MRRIVSAIAALLISITTANAQTSGIGPGTQTCNEFGRAYQQTQQLQQRGNVRGPNMIEEYYFSWAQGFFTGLNIVPVLNLLWERVGPSSWFLICFGCCEFMGEGILGKRKNRRVLL